MGHRYETSKKPPMREKKTYLFIGCMEDVSSCATELADSRHGLAAVDFSPTLMVNRERIRRDLLGHKNGNFFRRCFKVDEYPDGSFHRFHVARENLARCAKRREASRFSVSWGFLTENRHLACS